MAAYGEALRLIKLMLYPLIERTLNSPFSKEGVEGVP
jgi:hypothetical protein